MADVNANIGIHIDTSQSLAEIKNLQRQLAQLYTSINRGSAAAAAAQKGLATNLMNSINASGKFYAQMGTVRTSTESFTHALEKNKLTMREYFRYAGGATKTFGRLFKSEYNTIGKVAEERVKKMQTQYVKLGRDASGAMRAISITPTTLNMKDYGTQLAIAAQKQAILNQLLKQGSTNLLNFGKNTQWAGRQLMVGFTVPLAYFGTAAAKVFMDLEAQALKFRRVYGSMFTTSGETEAALKQIQDLAQEFTKYGVAVVKTMEMAASAAAMGKTGADLTAQVAEATRLAVLGGVEQQQALETTISITNAFGVATEDLAKKIDFLNAVENQTVVSIEDLTIAVPKAGPVVKQLGGNVEDLAFFLTAMKEGGINASEGANALKSGLASLINPTDKASKMLASMGINIKGIVEANKGDIKATVVGFASALDTLDPLNRARAIEQLFGKFQFARLSTLFQNVTKEGTQASRVFGLMGASVEELAILSERELKAVEDSVGVNFKQAVEELKMTIAPIGKEFLKAITPVVEFFGKLLDKFNGLGDGTKKFIVILTTLLGLVGPTLLMTFGLLANGAANIIKLFILMRQGFLKLSGKSNVLAQQTQYLNQEQLEAATVATSLNQAHSKLTQQFTIEASAVNALRNAYIQATTAARNFAAANPGMMMPGFGGKGVGPIKGGGARGFASGTTEVVGGVAGKDSVPSLLTPGEAVIPEPIAQDERFKPLVAALVTGEIAKYNTGTTKVQWGGNEYNAKTAKSAQSVKTFLDGLVKNPNGTYTYVDPKDPALTKTFAPERLGFILEKYAGRGDLTLDKIKRGLELGKSYQGRGAGGSSAPAWIKELKDKANYPNILAERDAVVRSLEQKGIKLSQSQLNNLFQTQASHVVPDVDENGKKVWRAANIVPDSGWVNNYLNRVKGNVGKELMALSDKELKRLGIDRKELRSLMSDRHPTTGKAAATLANIARYDIAKNPRGSGVYQAHAVVAGMDYRSATNFYPGSGAIKTLAQLFPTNKKVVAELAAAKGETVQKTSGKTEKVTGQTGKPLAPGQKVVGGGPSDKRVIPAAGVARVIPIKGGFKGPTVVTRGAQYGYDATGASTIKAPGLTGPQVAQGYRQPAGPMEVKVVQNPPPTPEQQKAMRAQQLQARMGQASMAAGGIAMVGMISGNMELAKFAGALSAATGILSMLPAKFMGIGAALMLAGAAVYSWTKAINEAKKQGYELAKAMTMTSDKLIALSKVTGKVSAVESADLKRKNILTGKSEAQRKTGQTILQSDAGKAILASISTQSKAGGTQQTVGTNVGAQLVQAVLSNAMTVEQARSFAAAIGEELNDYTLSANIEATIVNLLGPNGENLTKDPMKIALEVDRKSFEQTKDFINYVNKEGGILKSGDITKQNQGMQRLLSNQTSGKEKAVAAVGVGALTVAGAAIGGPLGAALGAAMGAQIADTVFDPAKSGLDKVVAVATLGLVPAFFDLRDAQAASLKMHTAGAQLMIEELRNNQMILDSVNKQYDIQLKSAKTEKERATIEENRRKAIKAVTDQNAKQMEQLIKMKDMVGAGAFNQAVLNSVQALYKEGPMKDIAETVTNALNSMENSKYKTFLQLELASGNIDPMTIKTLMENKSLRKQFNLIAKTSSDKDASTIFQLLQKAGYEPEQIDIILNTINPDGTTATGTLTEISETLANLKQTYGININVTTGGPQAAANLKTLIGALGDKQKITKKDLEVIAKTNPQFDYILQSWNTLVGNDPKAVMTRTMLLNVVGMSSGDSNVVDFYLQSAGAAADKATAEAFRRDSSNTAAAAAMKGVQERAAVYVAANPQAYINYLTPGAGDTGDGDKGKRDTTLDELLKRLKFVRDASINAQGGLEELLRITKGEGINKFTGVIQQLAAGPKGGFNREFISFLEGMDNATRKTYMTVKNGQVILTKQGKALKEAFNEKVIGEYQVAQFQALQDTKAQGAALIKLQTAGVDSATALAMVADANLAVAINSKNITGAELRNMADQAKAAKQEMEALNLEVLNLAQKLKGEVGDAGKTIQALIKAREAGVVDPDMLEFISKDMSLVNRILTEGMGGTAKGILAAKGALKELEDQTKKLVNPAQAAMETFSKLKEAAFKVFDRRERAAQAKFNSDMGRTVGSISKFASLPEQFKKLSLKNAISTAQKQVDGLNKRIQQIQDRDIKPIDLKIDVKESAIDDIMQALETQAAGMKKGFKLPAEAYKDVAQGLKDKIEGLQLDLEFNPKYGERFVEKLKDQISGLELDIELNFTRPIADLQEESSDLSNDLTLMDRIADQINKKYDAQAQALQKVSDINQDILNQQKDQLDVAGAITEGNIAAAARAAQEARSRSASASQKSGGVLEAAKQAEIAALRSASGMTRAQIEERQFQISQQVYQLEEQSEIKQRQIRDIQDQIRVIEETRTRIQREIRDIQDSVAAGERAREAFLRENVLPIETEIKGLQETKKGFVNEIKGLESEILAIQLDILDPLQTEADIINQQLQDTLDMIDAERQYWEDRQAALEEAVTATEELATAAGDAQKAFEAAKAAYDGISSKTVIIEIQERVTRIVDEVAGTKLSSSLTEDPNKTLPPKVVRNALMYGGKIKGYMGGGKIKPLYRPMGGLIPYMANGGFKPMGSDTVPAMLTPGEYVVNKASTKSFLPLLTALNESKYPSSLAKRLSGGPGDVRITRSFNTPKFDVSSMANLAFMQPSYDISNVSIDSTPVSTMNSAYNDNSSAVYNYNVGISVGGTNASPDSIAKAVMKEIKYIDSQRVRNQRAV